MRWTACGAASDDEPPPSARSGHSSTLVGEYVVVFGGTRGKNFHGDVVVLDVRDLDLSDDTPTTSGRAPRWFRPAASADGPSPGNRAFHSAVCVGSDLYVLCGRTGRAQHGDVWVLDTKSWRWSSLEQKFPSSQSTKVSPRDFGVATATPGSHNVVLFGGFDGKTWLNDLHVLSTKNGVWRSVQLNTNSPAPSPRSGHAGDALDTKRVLVFGGQGANGALCSDLWALKDVDFDEAIDAAELLLDGIETGFSEKRKEIVDVDEKKEEKRTSPVWTRLFLKGAAPSPRTGHSVTKFGSKILVWGGHGDDGWLVKQPRYYDDAFVVDMKLGGWRKLDRGTGSSSPSPRAFHTMTVVCNKVLLIGGFSGDKNDEPHGALSGAWWGTFREEEGCEGEGEKHGDTETGKHANSHSLSQTRQSAPIGGPPETFGEGLNGVRRVFGSGLGTFVGMATRGAEMPVGFQRGVRQVGFGDLSSSAKQNKTGGLSAVPTDKNALLASVLVSVERLSAASDVYPELGEEGRRLFFASCDSGDLRVGDLKHALQAYRRAVPSQGLGMPRGLGMSDDEEDELDTSPKNKIRDPQPGRFMHVAHTRLRMQDVPAMLTELQGALIAEV